MAQFDVFNGDADGICALIQLRVHAPTQSALVTGTKRDIQLLSRVDAAAGDRLTVLDISLDKNRAALLEILARGAHVFYADHHFPGEIPEHERLTTLIETTGDTCTSLLVDRHLGGVCREWAVVGAFGDNLDTAATELARSAGLSDARIATARELGRYINYNGYGASLDDLLFHPAELYELLSSHRSPFDFLAASPDVFDRLSNGFQGDMAKAARVQPHLEDAHKAVYILPQAAWARRVSGAFSNQLARRHPQRAHAVLTEGDGCYVVSVRAPMRDMRGADDVCRQFPSGGGRRAAAGINALPFEELDSLIDALGATFDSAP